MQLDPEQRLYCAAFVHRAIAFGDIGKRQFEVENPAWADGAVEHQVHPLGQETADWGRTAEQALLREEQALSVKLHAVRDPDEADLAIRAGTVVRQPAQASAPGSGHQLFRIAFPLDFDRRGGILDLGKVRGRQGDVDCSQILF